MAQFLFPIEVYKPSQLQCCEKWLATLTLSWRRPLSYRNQSIDLQSKSMDWFLYDDGLRHERVKIPLVQTLHHGSKSIAYRRPNLNSLLLELKH